LRSFLHGRKEPKETALIKQLLKFNTFRYDKINLPTGRQARPAVAGLKHILPLNAQRN
jgi:hypothetical protein